MNIRKFLFFASIIATALSMSADVTIVDRITAGGRNTVSQPEALTLLLVRQDVDPDSEDAHSGGVKIPAAGSSGYRVQVFLDNNAKTAQSTARRRAHAISSLFPEYRTYITYNSPYWRLRVGDFRTHAEATAAAAEIRSAFPATAKEVRVVRDRINR